VGVFEGLLETFVESSLTSCSLCLLLFTSLGSLLLKSCGAGGLASLDCFLFGGASSLGVRVESLHESLVLEGILLTLGGNISVDTLHAELGLDLVRIDDSGKISAGHEASAELEAALLDAFLSVGTEDVVEGVKGIFREDNESAKVTTRGELKEIYAGNVASIDARQIPSRLLDLAILITVDDQGSLA